MPQIVLDIEKTWEAAADEKNAWLIKKLLNLFEIRIKPFSNIIVFHLLRNSFSAFKGSIG
jgi:hypothetical protein